MAGPARRAGDANGASLRGSEQQETGLVDCGQGNGASADADAITNGCPLFGQPKCGTPDFCAPMKIYDPSLHSNGICDPELRRRPAQPSLTASRRPRASVGPDSRRDRAAHCQERGLLTGPLAGILGQPDDVLLPGGGSAGDHDDHHGAGRPVLVEHGRADPELRDLLRHRLGLTGRSEPELQSPPRRNPRRPHRRAATATSPFRAQAERSDLGPLDRLTDRMPAATAFCTPNTFGICAPVLSR